MLPKINRVGEYESNQKLEKNEETNYQSRIREVNSRYKSPTPIRHPSPNTPRTFTKTPLPVSTRAISTERKRPVTPKLPLRPSTPVHDTSFDTQLAARKTVSGKLPFYPSTPVHDTSVDTELAARKTVFGGKLPESLWPSRTRSLNVSFQSDTFSLSTSKREKPPPQTLSNRPLKSSSNVSQKRVTTPERKRSPLKGKNIIDHSENSKPLKTGSKNLNKNVNLPEKPTKIFIPPYRNVKMQLEKSASDPARLLLSITDNNKRLEYDNLQRMSNLVSSSLSVRSQSLPASGARPFSPSKGPKRPISPAHFRGSSPLRQPCDSNNKVSVLTFVADIKKGKKVVDQIEDAHYLRLLYNRQIQWRFVNARAKSSLQSQKLTAEKSLNNVWRNSSELKDSVAAKRIELDQLRLKLKLYSVLNQQMGYLNEWGSIEKEQNVCLCNVIEDLESSTLRLPVTEGATVDIKSLKSCFCSAMKVMQTMGSSLHSTLSKLEGVVSEVGSIAAHERALLDECHLLLLSASSLQVKEYSLKTHLLQLKQES